MSAPLIRVEAGRPDEVELAAVTALLAALLTGRAPAAPDDRSGAGASTWLRRPPGTPDSWTAGPGRHLGEAV